MITEGLDLAGFEAFGADLGRDLPSGSVVWLEGPLGAGKTTLVRAIVRGRGVRDDVSSPTYNLVHHYHGPGGAVYHVDCYRMRHPDEAADLDWEALLGGDLVLIEWPRRAGEWAPQPTRRVTITPASDDSRTVEVA